MGGFPAMRLLVGAIQGRGGALEGLERHATGQARPRNCVLLRSKHSQEPEGGTPHPTLPAILPDMADRLHVRATAAVRKT